MFEGFSPETIDFLWGIRMNNNREWFMAHKQQYVDTLYEPMKALGQELFVPFMDKPGNILKVSRIYRDARLHHPDPYKERLWACIRQDAQWWAENPCLFFEICPEGITYGFSVWKPKVTMMEEFRREITAKPDEFLELIRKTEKDTGIPVTADLYKRPKQTGDPRLETFYSWRGNLDCTRAEEPSEAIFGPALGQRVGEMFRQLMPLYDYFNRFKGE